MICALTVRELKPGMFEEFHEKFMVGADDIPQGWVRFNMIRNAENPDEVITFGFFDGTIEEVRAPAAQVGYEDQLESIAPFVGATGADGLYEVIEDHTPPNA